MNPFILMILFSGLLCAQTDELDKESFKSKKNTFLNERARLMKAHEDYWAARKQVQEYDAVILAKEKRILTTQVKMSNVEQAIYAQDHKRKDKLSGALEKETIFTKTSKGYTTVDANDDEQFLKPTEGAKELCLADKSKCFPFKIEDGKRVLTISQEDKAQEIKDLKAAKKVLERQYSQESFDKNAMIRSRSKIIKKEEKAGEIFDENKEKFVGLLKDDKAGMDEAFVDQMLKDSDKEKLFGDADLDAEAPDSKSKMIDALSNKFFAKDSYAQLKGKADDYQQMDLRYLSEHQAIKGLKDKYKLNSSVLEMVTAPAEITGVATLVEPDKKVILPQEIEETPKKIAMPPIVWGDPDEVIEIPEIKQAPKTEAEIAAEAEAKAQKLLCITEDPECKTNKSASTQGVKMPPLVLGDPDEVIEIPEIKQAPKTEAEIAAEAEAKAQALLCITEDPECKKNKKADTDTESAEALCKKEAIAKIIELFKDDKQNVLGKQFNLTAMKTALFMKKVAAPGSVSSSVEDTINKNQKLIATDKNIEALKKAYAEHGLEKAGVGVDQTIDKMKNGKFNYFSTTSRMTNDEASQMLLILSKSESPIKFGMEDAAITWAFGEMGKVQRKSLGDKITAKDSVELNKLSLSVQVNKLISSTVAGGTNMSVEKLESGVQKLESEIRDVVKVAVKSVSDSCQNILGEDCLIANDLKHDALAEMMKTILSHQETKMDDKQLSQFYMKVNGFIGKPSKEDLVELGKAKLNKKLVLKSPADNTNVLKAVGQATVGSGRSVANVGGGVCYVADSSENAASVEQEMCGDLPPEN